MGSNEARWEECLEHLRAFRQEHGHVQVPYDYKCADDGYALGHRVSVIRRGEFVRDRPERIQQLEALDFVFDANEERWEECLERLREFRQEHGHLQVAQDYKCADGYALGQRVHNIRTQGYFVGDHPERIKQLEEIGFIFDAVEAAWEEFHHHLFLTAG